jgi:DnaJ like chaperone protein
MTLIEVAVIIFGVFAGYWVVSKLFFRPPPVKDARGSASEPREAERWHDILGVASTATAEQIRDAYKHLVSKYHPDKVDTLGQELKDLAEHKTQEITLAYREGMRARGVDP